MPWENARTSEWLGQGGGGYVKGGRRLGKLFTRAVICELSLESQGGFCPGHQYQKPEVSLQIAVVFSGAFFSYQSAIAADRGIIKDMRNVSLWQ